MAKWTFLFIALFALPAQASTNLNDIWRNNQAADHLTQQKMHEALSEFSQLLAEKPFHPLFQFNLGASFIGTEEPDKAIKMYNEILKLNPIPPVVEFGTYYNLGVLHAAKGEIDQALENYQKALAINPDSKEIKTNIELLFQQKQGGGKGKDKNKDQSEEKGEEGEQPKEPQEFTNKPQQQPGQFDGKEMSKSDVNKILDELKKQEQQIRANHERKGAKEADRDKNW